MTAFPRNGWGWPDEAVSAWNWLVYFGPGALFSVEADIEGWRMNQHWRHQMDAVSNGKIPVNLI